MPKLSMKQSDLDTLTKTEAYLTSMLSKHGVEVKEFLEYDTQNGCFVGRVLNADDKPYGFVISPTSSKVVDDAPLKTLCEQIPRPKGFQLFPRKKK